MATSKPNHLGRKLYPELQWLEDRADRAAVFRAAQRRLFINPWGWLIGGPLTVGFVLGVHHARLWALGHTPVPAWTLFVLALAVLVAYVYTVSTFVFVRLLRRHIRAMVRDRGVPLCPGCGYNLHGLSGGRCPECGHCAAGGLESSPASS